MNILLPPKLKKIGKYKNNQSSIKILDVGSGNASASLTKKSFKNSIYYGVDKTRDYNYKNNDFRLMEDFYELDLDKCDLSVIPNDFFDVIIMAHVIEHLENGERVLIELFKKLKYEGIIYIEFPSKRSERLPSMTDTLNFYDDPTHLRIYSYIDLSNLCLDNNLRVLESGNRRDLMNILMMPLKIPYHLIKYRHVKGSVFWDIFGFAEFVLAQKTKNN